MMGLIHKEIVLPELTLTPSHLFATDKSINNSSELSFVESRKRKFDDDHLPKNEEKRVLQSTNHESVDLQLKYPLPLDWEQCLDLTSGRMYYQNKRTLKKRWETPNEDHNHTHKLDLELNISTFSNRSNDSKPFIKDDKMYCSSSNMVALPCLNCHLLVILSKSSPTCPNCKYIDHSLHSQQQHVSVRKNNNVKSFLTLSLLK